MNSSNALSALSVRLQDVMRIDPAHPALWESEQWWTWGQVEQTANAVAEVLSGSCAGARVAVLMRTTARAVACQLALLSQGCTIFTISPMTGGERLIRDVASSGAELVLADAADWQNPALAQGCEQLGAPGYAVWPTSGLPLQLVCPAHGGGNWAARSPLVANVMLTSGTTGPPKRIDISYLALSNMLGAVRHYSPSTRSAQDGLRLSSRPAVVASPLVHSSGFGGVLRAVAEARSVVLLERFTAEAWSELIARFEPRVTALPPTALQMILDANIEPSLLHSLRALVVGSAALPAALQERFERRYGIPLLSTYGATEFPGGLAGWTLDDRRRFGPSKRGSVGRAHPGVELRIVPQTPQTAIPPGGRGLLAVRTPATDRAENDGWVVTNDVASIDSDGFLYIHGRADDAIVRGGFKIIPQELEEVLMSHPAVRAAGVVGKPDDRLGEVPVAFVEVTIPVTADELLGFVRSRVMAYQVPVELHVLDRLPRTPSLKISKPELRDLVNEPAAAAEEGH